MARGSTLFWEAVLLWHIDRRFFHFGRLELRNEKLRLITTYIYMISQFAFIFDCVQFTEVKFLTLIERRKLGKPLNLIKFFSLIVSLFVD